MATRKRQTPKGRGGSSGGANPRNDGRITEEQHDDAMRVLRAEYYQSVRRMTEDLKRAIKDGEVTDQESLETWIQQSVDGSYWVIYTHANFQVLMCSDNHDAYSEDFEEPPLSGSDINWAALAYAAMQRDLQQQIDAEGITVEHEEDLEGSVNEDGGESIEWRWAQTADHSQGQWQRGRGRTEREVADHIASLVGSQCPVPGAYRPGRGAKVAGPHRWRMSTGGAIETRTVKGAMREAGRVRLR